MDHPTAEDLEFNPPTRLNIPKNLLKTLKAYESRKLHPWPHSWRYVQGVSGTRIQDTLGMEDHESDDQEEDVEGIELLDYDNKSLAIVFFVNGRCRTEVTGAKVFDVAKAYGPKP